VLQDFLHYNPVAPAVVGLVIAVILSGYWLTRREIARGERAEGPPAAHPFALLVQSLLVLLANRWLLVILLGLYLCAQAIGWPAALEWSAWSGRSLALFGPPIPSGAAGWFEGAHSALWAVRDGLPRVPPLVPLGLLLPFLGLGAAAWLLRRCVDPPDWMHRRLATRALWIALLSGAGAAWTVGYVYQRRIGPGAFTSEPGPWEFLSTILLGLPCVALVSLYASAAIYELVVGSRLTYSRVSRRVINTYFPWLAFCLLVRVPELVFSVRIQAQHELAANTYFWAVRCATIAAPWLPILLFPVPWVLLSRGCGLWLGLRESLKLYRDNAVLVLAFSLRLTAVLFLVLFVLGLTTGMFSESLAPRALVATVELFVTIVTAMAVCRACVSMLGRERPALANTGPDHAE